MEQVRKIEIDATKQAGQNQKQALRCVSAARANLLLRSDHQAHLKQAVEECGFKYCRFHGIFQDDMGVYREDAFGKPVYSWEYVDQVYDFLLTIGIRPFVVFDFMPGALASGDAVVYWEKANVTPPASYEKWSALIVATAEHFTQRYGKKEVEQWYFEVWNEPDNPPFFSGTLQDYCKLYEVTAHAVKQVCSGYRVGGPAIASNVSWVSQLIQHCRDHAVGLDFISAHSYATMDFDTSGAKPPATEGIPTWNPGPSWALGNQCYNPKGLESSVQAVKEAINNSAMPHLELHYTEWGLTWDYWDPLRDSYQAASYLLSRIHAVEEQVNSLSYCEISDVFEEDGPPFASFHGGFGLMNLQGIRKAAYFAYWFLSRLGQDRVACEDTGCIATSENGALQILLWDDAVRQDQDNKHYYNREHIPCPAGRLCVSLSGMAPGNYLVHVYGVGYQRNDAYTMYLNMNKQGSLRKDQVTLLKSVSLGQPLETQFVCRQAEDDTTMVLDTSMRENDVYLLTVTPY